MGDYDQATDYLTRSIALARNVEDQRLEAKVLNNLSLVYDEQGDYQRSLEQYQRALELHRATEFPEGATLGNIGGVYLLLGQYREAMRNYQEALAISERLELKPWASQDLGNLALCYLMLGQVDQALGTFDRALELARESGLKKEEANWLKGKGMAWVRLGEYDQAFEAYRQSVQFYEEAGANRELIEALHERGALQVLLGDLASGERDFHRAITLARSIGHPRGVTFNLIALGDVEWRRKRYEESAALYRQALLGAREADERDHIAITLMQLALTYREQGRIEEGLREAQQALGVARGMGASFLEAQAFLTLGEVTRAQGALEEALDHYAAGEEIAGAVGEPELGWRIAYGQGQALEALERNREAVHAYQRGVRVIEGVRSQLREERFRAGYIEDKYQVYVALVELQLKLEEPREAFLYAEKLRAQSYLDLLNRGLPPIKDEAQRQTEVELRERIRQLQRAIEEENTKRASQQRRRALEVFSSELTAAERAYEDLVDDLKRTQPAYASARSMTVPSAAQVQRLLPDDTALIDYVVAPDIVAVFVLTANEMRAKALPLRAMDLRAKVELLRELLTRKDSTDWQKPAKSLRRALIEPLEQAGWLEGMERLYLVPHAVLHYVPFAALSRRSKNGVRYLTEDYVLSYLPAATALAYRSKTKKPERGLLALAPERARLKYAQEEARSIAEIFAGRGLALVGSGATESSFKRLAGQYEILHLATHGYFNKLNPLLSGMELEPDEHEDGRLAVHEILGLRLKANLVTLSACETALGSGYFTEVPAGDDFVGLTRAFLFAGSTSLLASLWEVDDWSTLSLMRRFYRHLGHGDKAEALTEAQRAAVRASGPYSHPYHWAAFVLVGR